jgi:hypothetical protein
MWLNVCVGESATKCLSDDRGVLLARRQRRPIIDTDLSKSVRPLRVDPTVPNVEREQLIRHEQRTGDRRAHCGQRRLICSDTVKGPVAGAQNITQSLLAVERRSSVGQFSNHEGAGNVTARMSAETVRNCDH